MLTQILVLHLANGCVDATEIKKKLRNVTGVGGANQNVAVALC